MTTSRLIRAPLWATLLIALVAAMVSLFAFVPSSEGAIYDPQIINGEPVPDGKYPFMASVQYLPFPGTTARDDHNCGGSLIDKKHVLTAGHCVLTARPTGPPVLTPRQDLQVIVGRTVLNSDQGHVLNVKDIDVHPKYPGAPFDDPRCCPQSYDVAVLTLDDAVKGIKPIELATSNQNNLERPGRLATLAGWGDVISDPDTSLTPNRMQETQLPIVSDSRADKVLGAPPGSNFDYVPPLMIAAGGKQSNQCSGDSGGPLFVQTSGNGDGDNGDDDNGGKYTQIGIVSWGPQTCLAGSRMGAYTEVNAKPIASFIERAADLDDDDDNDDN